MAKEKQYTFTIMHGDGEVFVDEKGNKYRAGAYETFKSVMTPELQEKVDKGYLTIPSTTKNTKEGK